MVSRLIATDMDGTFLRDDHSFDRDRLANLLAAFKKQDDLFVVSSGRSYLTLRQLFAEFADQIAFVAENGTYVRLGDQVIFQAKLDPKDYLEAIQLLIECPYMKDYHFLLSGEKGAYAHAEASQDYVDHASLYYDNIQRVTDLSQIDDTILKITAQFSEEASRQGENWFNQQDTSLRAVTTGFQSIDIILTGVDKGFGLAKLCQHLGLGADQVIAFGDNLNDLEMLRFAGKAIATANAQPDIKAIADQVIGHCNDESVLTYMEGLVNNA